MSHVLQVWEDPIPASHEDAEAIVDMLMEGRTRRRPRLNLFRALMLARFPLVPTSGATSAWSDSSIERATDEGVLGIGLAPELRQEALAHAISMARVANVVLKDDQSGLVHLPDGTAVTIDGRLLRIKDPPGGFWSKHAGHLLAASLHALLAPLQWNLVEPFAGWCEFSRHGRDGVSQRLVFNRRPQGDGLSFMPNLYLTVIPDKSPELLRRWPMRSNMPSPQTVGICYTLAERCGMPLQSDDSISVPDRITLEVLARRIAGALKPLMRSLDACLDLRGLDKAVNGFAVPGAGAKRPDPLALTAEMSDQSLASALIVAHLSGEGRLDAVRALVQDQVMRRAAVRPSHPDAPGQTESMDDALQAIAGLVAADPARIRSMH